MLKEKLLSLDFTANQTDVYLALLERGQTKVGPLISQTGFHRNIVYRALDDLIAQKLVSKISKHGVFYYSPIDPQPLINKQKEQVEIAQEAVKEIKSKKIIEQAEVLVLSGTQGVIDAYEMMVAQKENIYIIGATHDFLQNERIRSFREKAFEKVRKSQIFHHVLRQPQIKSPGNFDVPNKTKVLPKDFPVSPTVIWVCGHISVNIIWSKPETLFVIKNKKIADNYRAYFNLLWKKSK